MKSTHGLIFDIRRYSIHDGPGIRTTVFFKGCPLRCWWCHNPESQSTQPELMLRLGRCTACGECQSVCPQGAISVEGVTSTDRERCLACGECAQVCYSGAREMVGRKMNVEQVMAEIERDVLFYDQSGGGVTFSGGEPLMQAGFLLSLLSACRERGIHTTLDTSGYASRAVIQQIYPYVDLFLYDLKLMDPARHKQYIGASNRPILGNLRWLSERGCSLVVRIPLVPTVNDSQADLHQFGQFLAGLPHLDGVELMPYHAIALAKYESLGRSYHLPALLPPDSMQVEHAADILREYGLKLIQPDARREAERSKPLLAATSYALYPEVRPCP